MPMSSNMVGKSTKRFRHEADARWLMAYAAGLGDTLDVYFDTTREVVAHPVFCVCPEWPVVLDVRNVEGSGTMTAEEARRGVHATHHVCIHAPIAAGDVLFTTARIIGVEQRRPGAYQAMKLETRNDRDELLVTTHQGGLSRGVEVVDGDRWIEAAPRVPGIDAATADGTRVEIPVAAGAAHVYTECARIFNPIHTDKAVAEAAGLPDIILHGTATLALAISRLVETLLGSDPRRVREYACRFSAMVLMPSTLTLEITARGDGAAWFTVWNQEGQPAISDGYLKFA